MSPTEQSQIAEFLRGRRASIIEGWRGALDSPSTDVVAQLGRLADNLINLLLADRELAQEAEEIGASLAHIPGTQPDLLTRTWHALEAVSYTHLTLPTTPYV